MNTDIDREEFERLSRQVGERLATLTGLPLEEAVELAGSVCGCIGGWDDDGMLTFRDLNDAPVVRLPYADFADLLDPEDDLGEGSLQEKPLRSVFFWYGDQAGVLTTETRAGGPVLAFGGRFFTAWEPLPFGCKGNDLWQDYTDGRPPRVSGMRWAHSDPYRDPTFWTLFCAFGGGEMPACAFEEEGE